MVVHISETHLFDAIDLNLHVLCVHLMQGKIDKEIYVLLLKTYKLPELKKLAKESGLNHKLKKQELIEIIANKWVEKDAEKGTNMNSGECFTSTKESTIDNSHSHTKVSNPSKCDDISVIGVLLQTLSDLPRKIKSPIEPPKNEESTHQLHTISTN